MGAAVRISLKGISLKDEECQTTQTPVKSDINLEDHDGVGKMSSTPLSLSRS